MSRTRQWIPIGGLIATIAAASYTVVQLNGQAQAPTADLTNAAKAEVRDAQGRAVLQGQFMMPVEEDGNFERRAMLTPTGIDADASGEAEVEFAKTAATTQEVEFTVADLQPQTRFTFVVDGTEIASVTTDRRGRADVEVDVKVPGSR